MRLSMTSQQTAFFSKNGYIELAGLSFDPEAIFNDARNLASVEPFGRDLWRKSDILKTLTCRKLKPALSHLAPKTLRIGFDQWIPSMKLEKAAPIKDLFSIQGLVLCALFTAKQIETPHRRAAALGIPPFSSDPSHVLFVKPNIVLDWTLLSRAPVDLYLVAYTSSHEGVYVHNPKDPATHFLKTFSYAFGDTLKDPLNPLLS